MTLRLLHTSDWHLGHTLHDAPRTGEHRAFLSWLVDQLGREAIDALLIAGDVFDNGNPSAEAQEQWYRFLSEAKARRPGLQVIVTAGNHDSAWRLQAPASVLEGFGIRLTGQVQPRLPRASAEALVFPLSGSTGQTEAWVAAVPFLRMGDLPVVEEAEGVDPLIEGVRRAYEVVLGVARERRAPDQALLAMGHLYLTGTKLSELSEHKILGGNQHALPASLFPDDVTYAALGHLHLAQAVGREHVRYAGSPIPLSLSERDYQHQVVVVELERGRIVKQAPLLVPRTVLMLRVPQAGAAPLDEVLALLAQLPDAGAAGEPAFLEVQVRAEGPIPDLRAHLEKALKRKHVRRWIFHTTFAVSGVTLADTAPARDLRQLEPGAVLGAMFEKELNAPPSAAVLHEFHEALQGLLADEAAP